VDKLEKEGGEKISKRRYLYKNVQKSPKHQIKFFREESKK